MGTGSFTSSLTNLKSNTTYYVRAYATNEKGTSYGEVKSFVTLSGDGDGDWGTNQTFNVNGVSFTMIAVEGGTFQMGATSEQGSDAESDESPVHDVTLSSYYIGETEVTQELWEAVMGSNPSYYSGYPQRPVEYVSWNDCQEFITKLNQLTGKNFRLPTEAEWEYAARGGNKSKGYKYSGSNTIDNVAWYASNSSSRTHDVKTKQANELGIYDMSGNVWEWCQDWYGSYSSGSQTNPTGPSSGPSRVIRGGGWGNDAGICRVSNRNAGIPGGSSGILGLRLSLSQD
ncbi:MAG: formylglycine-generating enzyme family protein [Bacteroidales bacterium]|nr:formylglycine-generating enzyme family protein [Bacteroidales bacterium]